MSPPLLFLLDLNFVPFPISCSSFWTLCSYSLNEMQPWTCRIEKCCGGEMQTCKFSLEDPHQTETENKHT